MGSRFSFRVDEVLPDLDGFDGVALAGPVAEDAYNLAVGDSLFVPTSDGPVIAARCTGFPLANWGQERRDWVTVTVTGVRAEEVARGATAHAESN